MAMSFDLRSSRLAILYYNRPYAAREFRTILRNSLAFWDGLISLFTRTALRSTVLGSYVPIYKRKMRLASALAKVNLIFSYPFSWSLSQLREFNQHFPMAVTLSVGTAEIAFFLQICHSAFDRPLRFANSNSKLLLRNRRICFHCLHHGQLFQSAIQSAILAL